MDRDEFFALLEGLDRDRLENALWTLYWRGPADLRQRIEAQLTADGTTPARRREPVGPAPAEVLAEVREFVALARSGAYLGRDRRVRPKERTRWRFTFRRLAADAQGALAGDDPDAGAEAVELLVDLAYETTGFDYFRSEDPMQAAGFVVSDAVAQLWATVLHRGGFGAFAERAAPQLIRWESPYGWTRTGSGPVADAEVPLAQVLAAMLTVADHWETFAARYLDALDRLAEPGEGRGRRRSTERGSRDRAYRLEGWHALMVDRLVDTDAADLLDRLVAHPAVAGPEVTFLRAQLAERVGDIAEARRLVAAALTDLPGHREFRDLAARVGAPAPELR
jgi:hypothetical protein